jgi:hypothetical protein
MAMTGEEKKKKKQQQTTTKDEALHTRKPLAPLFLIYYILQNSCLP